MIFPSLENIIAVVLAGLLLSAIPGPAMLYVLSRSVSSGRMGGFLSSLGLACGAMVHVVLAVLGVSVFLNNNPELIKPIEILGSFYIAFLGIQTIRQPLFTQKEVVLDKVSFNSNFELFKQGFIVEALNPKTILFFVAFLPKFIDPSSEFMPYHMLVLGLLVPLTAVPSDMLITFTGSTITSYVTKNTRFQIVVKWSSGLLLVGISLSLFM